MEVSIRKIIRIGEKSCGVTIPREWLDKIGIKVGASVETSLVGNSIVIKPSPVEGSMESVIKISGEREDHLANMIIASYIEGGDVISIQGDRLVIRRAFNSVKGKLPGMIFIEKGETPEIRITSDEKFSNFPEIVKTMRSSIRTMMYLMTRYLETGNVEYLKEILVMDDELDSLHFIGLRTVKRTAIKMPREAIDLATVIKSLEHIGDAFDRASNYLMRIRLLDGCNAQLKEMIEEVSRYCMASLDAFISGDHRASLELLRDRATVSERILEISRKRACSEDLSAVVHELLVVVASAAEVSEASVSMYVRISE